MQRILYEENFIYIKFEIDFTNLNIFFLKLNNIERQTFINYEIQKPQ